MAPNFILDTMLDAFLKSQNYTLFLPILAQACGDLAEDADLDHLVRPGERMEAARPSTLGPGFTSVPGGDQYLNRSDPGWTQFCVK